MKPYLFQALTIADGLTNAFNSNVKPQIKAIANNVIVPIICGILIIVLIVKAAFVWKDYNKSGDVHWYALAIIFVALIVVMTAPAWMWGVVNW